MPRWKQMTREEAQEAGKDRYFTGELCWRGHRSQRFTSTGACISCLARKPSRRLPDDYVPEWERPPEEKSNA